MNIVRVFFSILLRTLPFRFLPIGGQITSVLCLNSVLVGIELILVVGEDLQFYLCSVGYTDISESTASAISMLSVFINYAFFMFLDSPSVLIVFVLLKWQRKFFILSWRIKCRPLLFSERRWRCSFINCNPISFRNSFRILLFLELVIRITSEFIPAIINI